LGGKGLPIPSIIEIYGREGSGKSTLVQSLVGLLAPHLKETAFIYVDTELKLVKTRFKEILSQIAPQQKPTIKIIRSNYIEDIQKVIEQTKNRFILIVDSVAFTTSREIEAGGFQGAKLASIWSSFFKWIVPYLKEYNGGLILVNQVRENVGGKGVKTPGGRAIKHAAGIRIKLTPIAEDRLKIGNREIKEGVYVELESVKNQYFPYIGKSFIYLSNREGFVECRSLSAMLKGLNIAIVSGAWKMLEVDGEVIKWQNDFQFCKKYKELKEKIELAIKKALNLDTLLNAV